MRQLWISSKTFARRNIDDFKDHLKTTIPQLYEEVIKLDANADTDMEKVMRMILDDLDRALQYLTD